VGAETEEMAPVGVVASGVLWHGRSRGRGSHERQPWAIGGCSEWVWWKVVVSAGRGNHGWQVRPIVRNGLLYLANFYCYCFETILITLFPSFISFIHGIYNG